MENETRAQRIDAIDDELVALDTEMAGLTKQFDILVTAEDSELITVALRRITGTMAQVRELHRERSALVAFLS